MTQRDDLVSRLREQCNGHPHAKIAWPHRILHEAATALEAKDAEIARLRNGCAFGGNACERLTGMAWAHTKSEAELRDALDRIAELERQLAEKNGCSDANQA